MILSDFLSRQKHDDSDPHEIIPLSFNMQNVLHTRYYNINEKERRKYLVQTRSQAKTSCTILPKVQRRQRHRFKCKTRKASYIANNCTPNTYLTWSKNYISC